MVIEDLVYVWHLEEPALKNWHSRSHHHPASHYEFHLFLSGDGTFKNGSNISATGSNCIHFTQPEVVHRVQPSDQGPGLSYYAILFRLEEGDEQLATVLDDPQFFRGFPRQMDHQSTGRIESMKLRNHAGDPYFKEVAKYELSALIFDLAGKIRSKVDPSQASLSNAGFHLERAMKLFHAKLHQNPKLSTIAESIGISEEHLIRLFRRHLGLSPMRWFQVQKLEAAIAMLTNSATPIKTIAASLGYASPFHFSRNFKDYTGTSPRDYRGQYFGQAPTAIHTKISSY